MGEMVARRFYSSLFWLCLVGAALLCSPEASAQKAFRWQASGTSWLTPAWRGAHPFAQRIAPPKAQQAPQRMLLRRNFGILRQRQSVVDSGAVILSLPVLIINFIPLLGNVVSLAVGMGQLGWSLAGLGMSAVGFLLMIPIFAIPGVALALGLLQAALLGVSTINLILALRERARRRDDASTSLLQPRQPTMAFGWHF